jgi:hypothetical protein
MLADGAAKLKVSDRGKLFLRLITGPCLVNRFQRQLAQLGYFAVTHFT